MGAKFKISKLAVEQLANIAYEQIGIWPKILGIGYRIHIVLYETYQHLWNNDLQNFF